MMISAIWDHAIQLAGTHPLLLWLLVFSVACSESLALVGLLVPGTVLMLALAVIATASAAQLALSLSAALAGAIVGDWLSYALGWHYRHQLDSWPRLGTQLHRARRFFARYGALGVFCARFIGPLRPLVPLVAGACAMPRRKFIIANVSSALLWSAAYLLPGSLWQQLPLPQRQSLAAAAQYLALAAVLGWLAMVLTRRR